MAYMSLMAILFIAFAPWAVGLFSPPECCTSVCRLCAIVSLGYFFYAYGMVLSQSFNGAGDAMTPVWLNIWFASG
jgi:Na+-driven multidrug efflux pump